MSYAQIRLAPGINFLKVRGRRIARHGLYGNITMLAARDALNLIDRGLAKLPKHMSLRMLRERVAADEARQGRSSA